MKPQIKGSLNTLTVCGLNNSLFNIGIVVNVTILSAVNTGQSGIIISLKPDICHISGKCESNGITGRLVEWIGSQIILLKPYTCDPGTLLELCVRQSAVFPRIFVLFKSLLVIHGNLLLYDLILTRFRIIICKKLAHFRFIQSQHFSQCFDRRFNSILVFIHFQAVKDHIINLVAGCQNIAVAVVNVSTFRRQRLVLIFLLCLAQYLFPVFTSACGINIGNSCHQTD